MSCTAANRRSADDAAQDESGRRSKRGGDRKTAKEEGGPSSRPEKGYACAALCLAQSVLFFLLWLILWHHPFLAPSRDASDVSFLTFVHAQICGRWKLKVKRGDGSFGVVWSRFLNPDSARYPFGILSLSRALADHWHSFR